MLDIAIVDGVRTPFAKAFGPLAAVPAQDLGASSSRAASGADRRCRPSRSTRSSSATPPSRRRHANIARVIALLGRHSARPDRPHRPAQLCLRHGGNHHRGAAHPARRSPDRAGGRHRIDEPDPAVLQPGSDRAIRASSAGPGAGGNGSAVLLQFRPRHFKPVPAVKLGLTDPVCGLNMGETAEVLAEGFRRDAPGAGRTSPWKAIAGRSLPSSVVRLTEEIVPMRRREADGRRARSRTSGHGPTRAWKPWPG